MKKQDIRIVARVTKKEKERITALAKRCGLSTTEYLRQRALGYEPKSVPPDALFHFCERFISVHPRVCDVTKNSSVVPTTRTAEELAKSIISVTLYLKIL